MWSIGRIKARHSGKSLDVSGASIDGGARIIQNHEIDGRASQLWLFEPVPNSTPFRIVNQHSRKVLQVVDLHGEALPLTQEAKQLGDARQLFTFRDHSQKNFFLSPILRIFDDPVLDVHGGSVEDGAGVIVFPRKPEGIDNQLWQFIAEPDGGTPQELGLCLRCRTRPPGEPTCSKFLGKPVSGRTLCTRSFCRHPAVEHE